MRVKTQGKRDKKQNIKAPSYLSWYNFCSTYTSTLSLVITAMHVLTEPKVHVQYYMLSNEPVRENTVLITQLLSFILL